MPDGVPSHPVPLTTLVKRFDGIAIRAAAHEARCRTRGIDRRRSAHFKEARDRLLPAAASLQAVTQMAEDQPRPRQAPPATASQQLEALLGHAWPFTGRPPVHDLARQRVTDDWPDPVPATEAQVALLERWFADLVEEITSQGE